MASRTERIRRHFDGLAPELVQWRSRNWYYHQDQIHYIRSLIGENKRVLELGCGSGDLLNSLKPAYGVGIDISLGLVQQARRKYPGLKFIVGDASRLDFVADRSFDCIILSDFIGYLDDVQTCLEGLHRFCAPHTRIIVSYYNFLWQPLLELAESLGLKMPTPDQNWLSPEDLANLLFLSNFEVVKVERRLLFPKYVPVLSGLLNRIGTLPVLNRASLCHYIVARPLSRRSPENLSTSIIIPCRNEEGNIEATIRRIPQFGAHQEIIFVDGHSTDGTQDEIKRLIALCPDKDINLLIQDGQGKADAVRKGFQAARGDILVILDADLTVPPEDLAKFYDALATGKAEFLNGSRLIYPMESAAMRTFNLIANKFFAMTFTWLLGQRFKDTLCGTKAMFRSDYPKLAANRDYFGDFDPFGDFDLIFGASKLNLKIVEIPIRYRQRAYGQTQIRRFRDGFKLLRMVLFAFRKLKGI